ncbi:MAG: hypothetical protein Q4B14_01420 [Clostridia bacterium]|nr:hypothetical protein [Clostridia bacterium]
MLIADSLLYGLYMGVVGFFVPYILPIYCFYQSMIREENIGKTIFSGRIPIYAAVFLLIFTGQRVIIESQWVYIAVNILSAILYLYIAFNLITDVRTDRINRQQREYEADIYEDINDFSNRISRKITDPSPFLMSLMITLLSSDFIYWCDFSIYSVIIKINYKNESMGLINILIFIVALIITLFVMDIIFSKFSKIFGKYIKKLIYKPFTITLSILFLIVAAVNVYEVAVLFW